MARRGAPRPESRDEPGKFAELLEKLNAPQGGLRVLDKTIQQLIDHLEKQGVRGGASPALPGLGGVTIPGTPPAAPPALLQKFDKLVQLLAQINEHARNTAAAAGKKVSAAVPQTGAAAVGPPPVTSQQAQQGVGGSAPAPRGPAGLTPTATAGLMGQLQNKLLRAQALAALATQPKGPPVGAVTSQNEQFPEEWFRGLLDRLSKRFPRMAAAAPGFSQIGQAVAQPGANFGQTMQGLFGGLSKLGVLLGPYGIILWGIGKLGEVVTGASNKLSRWTEELHNSNMQFAEFSGSMAQVQAQQEVRDIQYSQRRGDAQADSARDLADARERWRRMTFALDTGLANFRNRMGTFLENFRARMFTGLMNAAVPGLGNLMELQGDLQLGGGTWGVPDPMSTGGEWMATLGQIRTFEEYGRPARFGG